MNRYRFYWLGGDVDEGSGDNPAMALTLLGYSQGAVPALDYWELIDPPDDQEDQEDKG